MRYYLLTILVSILFFPTAVQAGFGISPGKIILPHALPGSTITRTISLSHDAQTLDSPISLTVEGEHFKEWVHVPKYIIFPAGKATMDIPITIDVSKQAAFGVYKGKILFEHSTVNPSEKGMSTTMNFGAVLDIALTVSDTQLVLFQAKQVRMTNAEAPGAVLGLTYPGRAFIDVTIENAGNIREAPSRLQMDVYDESGKQRLAHIETDDIPPLDPFETDTISIPIEHNLTEGSYLAYIRILHGINVIDQTTHAIHFTVQSAEQTSPTTAALRILPHYVFRLLIPLLLLMVIVSTLFIISVKRKREIRPMTELIE